MLDTGGVTELKSTQHGSPVLQYYKVETSNVNEAPRAVVVGFSVGVEVSMHST